MTKKIAIASTDGININSHFGKAEKFQIFELYPENNTYKFIEIRNVEKPLCHNHSHEEIFFKEIIKLLSDIHAIFVEQIGVRAYIELKKNNIAVYESDQDIESTIKDILNQKLWEEDNWKIHTNI